MSTVRVPGTRSRASVPQWATQTTATPAARLVASAPLADEAYEILAAMRPDLHEALATNPWLTPAAFCHLYRPSIPAEVALLLINRRLSPEEIDHVLHQARERRAHVLRRLITTQELSGEQMQVAMGRVRARLDASDILCESRIPPARKVPLLARLEPLEACVFVANHALPMTPDAVWEQAARLLAEPLAPPSIEDLESGSPNNSTTLAAIGALARILRRRPQLGASALNAGSLAIVALALVLDLGDDTALMAWDHAASQVGDSKLETTARTVIARRHALADQPQAVLDALSQGAVGPLPAFRAVELAGDDSVDPGRLFLLLQAQGDYLASWCGRDEVANAAMLCAIRAGQLDADATQFSLPSQLDVSGLQNHEWRTAALARPRPSRPYPPDARDSQQVLASIVGGGQSWGVNPGTVGAVISAHLGADAQAWEILLGLSDNFHGTVGELLDVASAATSPRPTAA